MVLFNHATREMTAKIVYYGPGLCGKTTNLMVIFDKLDSKSRGKMLSLATKTDRTLFFDLLPVDIGKIGAFNLKIQLYTVPGQVFYNETRKLVLKGADAVVFVADSQPSMVDSNRESFANLMENLQENDIDTNDIPIVIQYNKRDIPGVLPVETLQEELSFEGYPSMEAAAIKGEGVMETFKLVSKITAKHLLAKAKGGSPSPRAKKHEEKEEKKGKKGAKAAPPPPHEPEPVEPPIAAGVTENPFGDTWDPGTAESAPFGDTPFVDPGHDYEKVEEVSLEQLLEGRERPATFGGDMPIPVSIDEEVEHLDSAAILPDEPPLAVAIEEPEMSRAPLELDLPPAAPSRGKAASMAGSGGDADLHAEIAALKKDVAELRAEQKKMAESLRRIFSDFSRSV